MASPTLKLKITSAAGVKNLAIPKSTATIGAAAHCDVRIAHGTVETEHARAWVEGGRLWVQDLGSTSGTFLNGSRLPAMKPMLVRDLDALRIGESPETLGFEKPGVDLVRAPRVAAPAPYEHTLTEIRPAAPAAASIEDARTRDERARVSRELAEMRLALQMGQLEKNGVDELRTQVNELRAQLSRLEDERRSLKTLLAQTRAAEAERQARFESDLNEKRARTDLELAEMRDAQDRQLGQWKIDIAADITRHVRTLMTEKAQAWVKRPVSRDMIQNLETEITGMIDALVLTNGGSRRDQTGTVAMPPPAPLFRRQSSARGAVLGGLMVALIGSGVEYYRLNRPVSTRTMASSAPKNLIAKASLADNLETTTGFVELIQGTAWRKSRAAELQKAPWSFDARTVQALLDREAALVRDLVVIRNRTAKDTDALTAMHARETEFARALRVSFGNDAAIYDRFVAGRTAALQRQLAR